MLVEAAGGRVLIHPSPAENLKVTTPLDLRLAELLLAERLEPAQSRSRTQTSVAAKQSWPTPRAAPKLTAPSRPASAVPPAKASRRSEQLAGHCRAQSRRGRYAARLRC